MSRGNFQVVRGLVTITPANLEASMSKTNVKELQARAKAQVENTSAGGHLGGTYYGQQPDGKTASQNDRVGAKSRRNNGSK